MGELANDSGVFNQMGAVARSTKATVRLIPSGLSFIAVSPNRHLVMNLLCSAEIWASANTRVVSIGDSVLAIDRWCVTLCGGAPANTSPGSDNELSPSTALVT